MKQIAPAASEIPHKVNKLADTVGDTTLKYMGGKFDPVELEAWIKGIGKIFKIVEVPED